MGAVSLYRLCEQPLPFGYLSTEKQGCGPHKLPELTYPFELKRGHVPYLCKQK